MSTPALLSEHPLIGLGKAALDSSADSAEPAELAEFNTAISGYSEARSAEWKKVRELATVIAPVRTELRIFCYLTLSTFCEERDRDKEGRPYLALAAALSALADLIEGGWARCIPRAPKARDNQLDWLSRELAWVLPGRPPGSQDIDAFALCVEAAQRVGELHGQATGQSYALFRDARAALAAHKPAVDEMVDKAKAREAALAAAARPPAPPEPRPAERATPASPAASESAAAPAPAPAHADPPAAAPVSSAAAPLAVPQRDLAELDPEALADELAALVERLAALQRGQSLVDPAPYWMLRALRWASHDFLRRERVRELAAANFRTPLPPPPGHAALLEDAPKWLAQGQHARVIEACEEMFAQSPLFLDLQRLIALGLEGLGATVARQVVGTQVSLLLLRCPEVTRFRFGDFDATPMTSAETLTWLEGESARGAGAPANSPSVLPDSADAPLPAGLAEGVVVLQQRRERAQHQQEQFELDLRLAELLVRHERRDVALPLARSLIERASTYRLAEWRPDLLTRALRIGHEAAGMDESGSAERHAFFMQLCQISPRDAIEVDARRESA